VLRAMMEGHAVRQACAARRRLTISRLSTILTRMRKAAMSGDMALFSLMDFEFHRTLVVLAKMPRLYQLWSSLNGLLMIWLLSVQNSVRQVQGEVLKDHLRVIEAITAGDGPRAAKVLSDHMLILGERTLQVSRAMAHEAPRAVPPRRRANQGEGNVADR
jgi:DNA-binding GntR family transcriptional regulator